jgi:hypothetical protein
MQRELLRIELLGQTVQGFISQPIVDPASDPSEVLELFVQLSALNTHDRRLPTTVSNIR